MSRGSADKGGGLETADMNDGEILSKTKQAACGKNGFQLSYTLPSGRELTSECVNAEYRSTKLLNDWVDAVKTNAVADVDAEREEQQARARREAAERKAAESKLIVPDGTGVESSTGASPATTSLAASASPAPPRPAGFDSADPVAMAKAKYVSAAMEVIELAPKLAAAQGRMAQWKAVLETLQKVELPRESPVIETPNAQLLRDLLETR